MTKYNKLFPILLGVLLFACKQQTNQQGQVGQGAVILEKFEPADGECILFVGQDLGAIGGFEGYSDGYLDHFEIPGGFTMYTNFRPGDTSYGHVYRGLDGVKTTDNWGSGDCNMQMQIDNPKFKNSALAIGLELVNHDSATAYGVHDSLILELGKWINGLGERPVFLRIGYEFDAPDWNNYDKEHYKAAFKHIKTVYDSMGIDNIAYVWQSKGFGSTEEELAEWYPGDEHVDWCGYTHFVWGVKGGKPMIDFARKHNKPVFIAEATPMLFQGDTLPQDCFLDNPEHAKQAWETWFVDFFKVVEENPDVVKAISYINVDWPSQAMWENNPPFKHIDSRIQVSPLIKENWMKEISKEKYLKASPDLFNHLWGQKK